MLNLSQAQRTLLEQRLKGRSLQAAAAANVIPRRAERDWAPVSFVQEELLRAAATGKVPPTYLGTVLRFSGELDLVALRKAVNAVSERHEPLRTAVTTDDTDGFRQVIQSSAPPELKIIGLEDFANEENKTVVQKRAARELARPFDRAQAPLWRVTVFRLQHEEYVLVIAIDDLIADFLSLGILIEELGTAYQAYCSGKKPDLPNLPIQYGDWAAWQRDSVARGELDSQFAYWTERLRDCSPALELPFTRPRPTERTFHGAIRSRELPAPLTAALRDMSRQHKVGLYTVLLCAFSLLMRHYAQREEFVLGRGVTGRTRRETERLIGCFINMVLLRIDLGGNPTVAELLTRIQSVVDGAYANQDVPFSELTKRLNTDLPTQIFFNLYTSPAAQQIEGARLSVFDLGAERPTEDIALFQDLLLGMQDSGNRLVAELKYNRDLFTDNAMDQLLGEYEHYLKVIVAAPEKRIQDLDLK